MSLSSFTQNFARTIDLLEIEEIASSNGDLLDILEQEIHFTELVTARCIGRVIDGMLKDSTTLLNCIFRQIIVQ